MIGYRKRGVLGAIAATLGEVTPSLVIIITLASLLLGVQDSVWIQRAFGGIRVAVCALITQAIVNLARKSLVDWQTIVLYLLVVGASLFAHLSPLAVIPIAIVYGLAVQYFKRRAA